ncbi:DUF4089 domain-containing protein [Xylophilus sp. GOD-11R]|uniref:DUF4089 domain-containing protein n=1 Tax=Xylophilus sp. GOD-11R TaxID=3089814 RepID=UPI00298D056C|nr:DUF4089 domain-containing protein [Xylophilus sp. GOD-11R]WPB57722.1 DUF4089 domain-containing protein [Xylophilus sp. GOD-11R]
MSKPTAVAIERHVDATAELLGLPIAPAHRPGVLGFFALAAAMAEIVEAVPLTPHDESPLRFEPVSPRLSRL